METTNQKYFFIIWDVNKKTFVMRPDVLYAMIDATPHVKGEVPEAANRFSSFEEAKTFIQDNLFTPGDETISSPGRDRELYWLPEIVVDENFDRPSLKFGFIPTQEQEIVEPDWPLIMGVVALLMSAVALVLAII